MKSTLIRHFVFLIAILFCIQVQANEEEWSKRKLTSDQLYNDGYYDQALIQTKKLLDYSLQAFGKDSEYTAATHNLLGLIYKKNNYWAEARREYESAIKIADRNNFLDLKYSYLYNLAGLLEDQGKKVEAKQLYLEVLDYRKNEKNIKYNSLANTLNALGVFHGNQGDSKMALKYYQLALSVYKNNIPNDKNYSLTLRNIGKEYKDAGQSQKAMQYYEIALEKITNYYGNEHIEVTNAYQDIANLHFKQGRYHQAKTYFQEALRIRQDVFGDERAEVADSLLGLADVYRELGPDFYAQSQQHYQKAVAIYKKTLGHSSEPLAIAMNSWGEFYMRQNQWYKAEAQLTGALRMHSEKSQDQAYTGTIAFNLGTTQLAINEVKAAEKSLLKALGLQQKSNAPKSEISRTYQTLAKVYATMGDNEQAEKYQRLSY